MLGSSFDFKRKPYHYADNKTKTIPTTASSTHSSRDRSISPPRSPPPAYRQRPHQNTANTFNNYNTRFDRVANNYNSNHSIKKPFRPYKQQPFQPTFQNKTKNYFNDYRRGNTFSNRSSPEIPITKPLPRFSPFDRKGILYTDGKFEKRIQNYRPKHHYNNNYSFKRFENKTLSVNYFKRSPECPPSKEIFQAINLTDTHHENSNSCIPSPYSVNSDLEKDANSFALDRLYHFRIRKVSSYKEFCGIKTKSRVAFSSPIETISFLNLFFSNESTEDDEAVSRTPIMFFFDTVDKVFYGAATLTLSEEAAESESLDTNTLESMIFGLNWIFLSEVNLEDSNINIQHENEVEIECSQGLHLLKLMESYETQLHDLKKLKAASLKLKRTRLNELSEFFQMTESKPSKEIIKTLPFNIEIEESISYLTAKAHDTAKDNSPQNENSQVVEQDPTLEDSDDDFFADYDD
jgi:hypothetical protein